jgi:hypothetical protein
LCLDLLILLDVDVLVGLEDTDLVFGKFHTTEHVPWSVIVLRWEDTGRLNIREALDKGELVLDLATIGLRLVLSLVEFLRRGVLLERDLARRQCILYRSQRRGKLTLKRGMLKFAAVENWCLLDLNLCGEAERSRNFVDESVAESGEWKRQGP